MNKFEQDVNSMVDGIDKVVAGFPKEMKRLKKEMTKEDAEKFAQILETADISGKIDEYEKVKKELEKKLG